MTLTLADLGWSPYFQDQQDDPALHPMRLTSVTRSALIALGPDGSARLKPPSDVSTGDYAVGDWVLSDGDIAVHRLEPRSILQRRASGPEARSQLMAANVDTLGIVTACNADFNVAAGTLCGHGRQRRLPAFGDPDPRRSGG